MDECFLTESSVMQLNGNDDWDAVVGSDSFVFPVDDNGVVQETEEFDVLAVQMDISENLAKLKLLLGEKLACDLSYYQIWLQDIIEMDENSTLAEQCVQGEGTVQINVELKIVDGKDRINILDVLKPHEAAPPSEILPDDPSPVEEPVPETPVSTTPAAALQNASSENITRWVMDVNYRKEQDRRNIPYDPAQWSKENVMFWVNWAASHFKLNIDRMQWENMDGAALCKMTHADFKTKITQDPNDLFWTHLELLRKCKFVGVIQKPVPYLQYITTPLNVKTEQRSNSITNKGLLPKQKVADNSQVSASNRTVGNNGQVQLWQFLLELLTDKSARQAISWLGTDGEFRLNNPELVAQLWGERKNKPQMNYEKLSRALRYYYDGEMICKVPGKRFVYKFVCDLKELLGYSAEELSNLVNSTITC